MHFYVVLREELEDADVKLLQMITQRKLAPALTESASQTLAAIDIGNFPGLSLWIPECQLLVGVGKMLPDKFTWNNLQDKKVFQENGHLQYNGTSSFCLLEHLFWDTFCLLHYNYKRMILMLTISQETDNSKNKETSKHTIMCNQ